MRISKMTKPICFLLLICGLNLLLSVLLEYAHGASKTMWDQYYNEENIDVIFVGASVCSASFDPTVFDERLGLNTFNMGTPAQNTEQTLRALNVALEEHDIQTVIYGMGFFALQQSGSEDAELTFVKALSRQQGLVKGTKTTVSYLLSNRVRDKEKSVRYFFPWLYNGVDFTGHDILENLKEKLGKDEMKFDENSNEHKNWRLEKGFRPFTGVVDYSSAWEENSYKSYYSYFDYESTYYFEQILKTCKDKNVNLIVVNTPHPVYDVVSCYGNYKSNNDLVVELCKKYDATYYDYSLAKPDIFVVEEEFFYDFEHLNYKGARAFSHSICDLLEKKKNGYNFEKAFYTVDEFLELHNVLLEEWKKEE